MNRSNSLEAAFDIAQISDVCATDEATVSGGFFSIVNFDFSANYNATSGITTLQGVTRGSVNIQASGRGSARLIHRTEGFVRY